MKDKQSYQNEQNDVKNKNMVTGNSINEHRSIESANILIGEKEIGQQNENL